MAGQSPKVDHIRNQFDRSIVSARKLVSAVRRLSVVKAKPNVPSLHAEQVRRVVELAFIGLIANWEEFLEQTFVRYLAGASSSGGTTPVLRIGKTADIGHSYHVISGDTGFDPARNYSKFGDPRWVIDTARIYFDNGAPYAPRMQAYLEALQSCVKIRNRVAHNSEKCREDFKKVARAHLALPNDGKLRQSYSVGDLLMTKPVAIFNDKDKARYDNYFDAYCGLYELLADKIASK